ncbi:cytochrome c oxidase subunit II [Mangrovactinospora gilvigrisea]|uniref:Probable cytochrome c oxidase subunit 2 n=1 Tax=Mangrovactinospora gilvigrisea TaxID=1428644 RepID=A0A1J7BVR0_9ACTN|nr:cytochrome c oxidase subunit II [Mangrovactinospora gilvigrisea]OIV37553.1 cytochrome c oxidase subunit II [Mangrovactinospora gilvigrisea]
MSPNGSDRSPRRSLRRRLPQVLALGLVVVSATGCSSETLPRLGLPRPATEQAPRILHLWQGSWVAALAIGCLVWGLIIWSVIFHRRSRTKQEIPPQTRYNVPIEALYTTVPLIIIAVLFYYTARDESELMKRSKNPDATVNVVGFQWSWAFNYKASGDNTVGAVWEAGTPANPPTLYLPVNKRVSFKLTSRDVIHDFWVPSFLMKQDVVPGRVNGFDVTPNREGTFMGKCAELCGVDHSRMLFNVKVVSEQEYLNHLSQLKAKGQTGAVPAGVTSMGGEQ